MNLRVIRGQTPNSVLQEFGVCPRTQERHMNYTGDKPVLLTRDVQAVAVPAGNTVGLPEGTEVVITQALGGTYTLLVPAYGGLFRLASRDGDAIGKEIRPEDADARQTLSAEDLEREVWQILKTCYDPEIPVNIG